MPVCPALPLYRSPALRRLEQKHADQPLMERAGLAAAELASELAHPGGAVLVLAGPGNNGGDALVLARLLHQRFFTVQVILTAPPTELPDDARQAWERLCASGLRASVDDTPEAPLPDHPPAGAGEGWALIVDGLFGIGLSRPVTGRAAALIAQANALAHRDGCPLLALDTPSGLNADTGHAFAPAVIEASHTLTFIAAKPGLFTADGPDYTGAVSVATLGLAPLDEEPPQAWTLSREQFASALQARRHNSHKGSHGGAGIVGGAPGMVGAALLAGRAALLLGAGRVWLGLCPGSEEPHAPPALSVDPLRPELMFRPADSVLALPAPATLTALAIGPGLGTSSSARTLLRHALAFAGPLLLDADALNLLAAHPSLQQALRERAGQARITVLTPHPSEAARLLERDTAAIQADRLTAASELAQRFSALVALKGCGTVVASPEGELWVNRSGNPGLATAGSGDVLTGMILALLAQGWPGLAALAGAVHLHGAAADTLVAAGNGPVGLTADELALPARRLLNQWIVAGVS